MSGLDPVARDTWQSSKPHCVRGSAPAGVSHPVTTQAPFTAALTSGSVLFSYVSSLLASSDPRFNQPVLYFQGPADLSDLAERLPVSLVSLALISHLF